LKAAFLYKTLLFLFPQEVNLIATRRSFNSVFERFKKEDSSNKNTPALGINTYAFTKLFIEVIDFHLSTPSSISSLSIIIANRCDNNKISK
jgi:hypothetical protein